MTVDEISMLAYRNDMPDIHDLTGPEWLLWYRLRDVYRQNRDSPEEGAKQKNIMLRQYDIDCSDLVSAKEVRETLAAQWKRIEPYGQAYVHSGNYTPEADAFFESIYCVPRKVQKEQWEKEAQNGDD